MQTITALPTYPCRDKMNDGDWIEVIALDPDDAAKEFAEQNWCNWDYPERMEIEVRNRKGEIVTFDVTAEQTVVFSARERD